MYDVGFTVRAAGDVRQIAMDLHRRWGPAWGRNPDISRELVREWIVTSLEREPYSRFSGELGHPSIRHCAIDKGLYGAVRIGYVVQDEDRHCIVFLVLANGSFDEFLAAALQRAELVGSRYRR